MKMRSNKRAEQGFTLVEVLIAMFIFALISAGTMTALTGTLRGKAQMDERLLEINRIETLRAIMKSDFSNMRLLPMTDAYGGQKRYALSGGIENLVEFTRAGRANPGGLESRSEFQRVTYVFENGAFIRRALTQADPAPQTPEIDRVLMEGLENVSFKYHAARTSITVSRNGSQTNVTPRAFDVNAGQEHVLVSHDKPKNVPGVVSVELTFENGDQLTQHFELSL